MIGKAKILGLIKEVLEQQELFLVSLEISTSNKITVLIDSIKGAKIDDCVKISRAIEHNLDREEEDFALEVSTPGLDSPFRVLDQYKKNIGRDLEILLPDGATFTGKLIEAGVTSFTIETEKKTKIDGKKQTVTEQMTFEYTAINRAKVVIKLK